MEKKVYGKSDWFEFRKDVIDLVILYQHVKEYSDFDKDKIEYIDSFFHLSRKQAITSFFIKVGFLVTDGKPTFKDFLIDKPLVYDELTQIYNKKVGLVRNKLFAHNARTDKKMKNFSLSNDDVEEVYNKIILLAQEIDEKFDDRYHYDFVYNANGIKSIEPLIQKFIELHELKNAIKELNYKAHVELGIMDGKIKIISGTK